MAVVPAAEAVAAFDSATALLDGLARALDGRPFPALGQERWKVPLVRASTVLPHRSRLCAYALLSGREGVVPGRLADIDLETVAAWIVDHFPSGSGRFPGVLIGASNGALTHLAAACGVPWLPQTLLVPVRRPGADAGDLAGAMDFGAAHGPRLLAANPQVALHHMHDPEQDRLSASRMAYFRVKWRELPAAYVSFLDQRLAPGAPVVLVRDRSSWPVRRVGERHVFQPGAQGGASPEHYLSMPGALVTDERAPEAEWGADPELLAQVSAWAVRHGHPVVEIGYDGPQAPSAAVADVFREWLAARGLPPDRRLLVSSFVVHDPWRTIATGSVPYWTFFPVDPAADALEDYLDHRSFDDIGVMLFAHGVRSQGLAPVGRWQRIAGRARSRAGLLGVDPRRYPADFATFARYGPALARIPEVAPPSEPLDLQGALAALVGPGVEVRWRTAT